MVQKMIHAKESGNPKISGVAELNSAYPGQMMKSAIRVMVMQNQNLPFFRIDLLVLEGLLFNGIREYKGIAPNHKPPVVCHRIRIKKSVNQVLTLTQESVSADFCGIWGVL